MPSETGQVRNWEEFTPRDFHLDRSSSTGEVVRIDLAGCRPRADLEQHGAHGLSGRSAPFTTKSLEFGMGHSREIPNPTNNLRRWRTEMLKPRRPNSSGLRGWCFSEGLAFACRSRTRLVIVASRQRGDLPPSLPIRNHASISGRRDPPPAPILPLLNRPRSRLPSVPIFLSTADFSFPLARRHHRPKTAICCCARKVFPP